MMHVTGGEQTGVFPKLLLEFGAALFEVKCGELDSLECGANLPPRQQTSVTGI